MRNWELPYSRPSIRWEAIFMAVAILIHVPLITINIRMAAKKQKGKAFERLVNIDFVEEQAKKRQKVIIPAPPKIELPKILEPEKKADSMVNKLSQMFQRTAPPPPPPVTPKLSDQLLKGPETGKLQEKLLADKSMQQQKLLQEKGAFQGKSMQLSGGPSSDIKLSGGAAASLKTSRLSSVDGPAGGGTLKSKGGFQMAKVDMPVSIGGGSDGGIRTASTGGGNDANVVVIPVGSKTMSDPNAILAPARSNKGALQMKSSADKLPAGGPAQPALAGAQASAPISVPSSRQSVIAAPEPSKPAEEKKFADKQRSSTGNEGVLVSATPAPAPPVLPTLPKRIQPKAAQKPLFSIVGPLANRPIKHRELPAYPEWAQARGIEASVVLQFTVTPEGAVKENIMVIRTSGFSQMDELAISSLKKWLFEPLPSDQYREEVGSITFNFAVK
ncbi:MAG TPA: TonB family protein [Elusimicrobiota bacterium]|nr:TonB family protein [Elusimicrobiota bacterium]